MPVAFFAYPDKPSLLTPEGCQGHVLARPDEDLIAALEMLAEAVGARGTPAPVVNEPRAGAGDRGDHVGGAGRVDRRRCCRRTRSSPTRR